MTTVMLLAATMQGEVGVLDSDDAALAVFEVAWNRKVVFGFRDIRSALIEGFYGWRAVDTENIEKRYVRLACRALAGEHEWNHEALFMLSREDLEMLGGADHAPLKHYAANGFAVYLFEWWPAR